MIRTCRFLCLLASSVWICSPTARTSCVAWWTRFSSCCYQNHSWIFEYNWVVWDQVYQKCCLICCPLGLSLIWMYLTISERTSCNWNLFVHPSFAWHSSYSLFHRRPMASTGCRAAISSIDCCAPPMTSWAPELSLVLNYSEKHHITADLKLIYFSGGHHLHSPEPWWSKCLLSSSIPYRLSIVWQSFLLTSWSVFLIYRRRLSIDLSISFGDVSLVFWNPGSRRICSLIWTLICFAGFDLSCPTLIFSFECRCQQGGFQIDQLDSWYTSALPVVGSMAVLLVVNHFWIPDSCWFLSFCC